jgi:hypothetical protein
MKQHAARFAPWLALMVLGVLSTAKMANTAPPPEPHPHIRSAINQLREAREELRTAAHDFCGHRAEAVEKTDQALRQLQAALECDRR